MKRQAVVFQIDLEFPVTLFQSGRNNFAVQYGAQYKEGLTYSSAAKELGAAIMHAQACAGKLDNGRAT